MNKTESIRKANEVLRELDGDFKGDGSHQKFTWRWSPDLVNLVPKVNDDGNFAYDYVCQCGKDRRVHDPDCSGIIRAKVAMTTISSLGVQSEDPRYQRCWILTRWEPPPPFDDWVEMMGSEDDYPANGRYVPVSAGRQFVYLAADVPPTEAISRVIVQKMRQHVAEWREEYRKELENANQREVPIFTPKGDIIEDASKSAPYHKIRDRLKDAMTFNGHVPGKKDNTLFMSEPSTPASEPVLVEK